MRKGSSPSRCSPAFPTGSELRRHVLVPPEAGGEDPLVFAVRAVELLRDIYLDIPRVERRRRLPRPITRPPAPEESPRASTAGAARRRGGRSCRSRRRGVTWSLGVGHRLRTDGGVGVSFLSRLALVVSVAGPFHVTVGYGCRVGPKLGRPSGSPRSATRCPPALSARTSPPGWGSSRSARSRPTREPHDARCHGIDGGALLALGVGLLFRLTPWLGMTVDAREIATWPVLDVTADGGLSGGRGDHRIPRRGRARADASLTSPRSERGSPLTSFGALFRGVLVDLAMTGQARIFTFVRGGLGRGAGFPVFAPPLAFSGVRWRGIPRRRCAASRCHDDLKLIIRACPY